MESDLADRITNAWASYRQVRNQHSIEHIHIARYIRPELAEWFEERKTSDRPAIEKLWDDTSIKSNGMFARGLWTMAHNPATQWFEFSDKNKKIMNDSETVAWYKNINEDLRNELNESGCYSALLSRLNDVGAFGWGAMYSYAKAGDASKLAFEYVPASECFYTLDRGGLVNSFIRPLNLTASQAIDDYGWTKEKMDSSLIDAYNLKNHSTKFLFLHVVWERKGANKKNPRTNKDFEFAGYYYQVQNRTVVNEHGFRDFPYHVLGWGDNQPYPVGIGYQTLPEIRNINSIRSDYGRILSLEADSPILAPNQSEALGGEQAKPQPGEMLYGGMSGEGRRLYEPYYSGSGSRSIVEEINSSRQLIQEAWHYSLFMMQTQRQMTAEEVRSRDAKIIQAMGPFMIMFAKDLKTIIERVFYARLNAGVYDPLPAAFDENSELDLKFSGILAKAQQVIEGEQIVGLYAEAQLIAQYDPDAVVHGMDHAAALRHLGSSKSIPQDIILTKEAYDKKKEEIEQQKQEQMAAQMAPGLASAAKDGASAMKDLNENAQTSSTVAN